MHAEIGRARAAGFFRAPEHHPDGAGGMARQLRDQMPGAQRLMATPAPSSMAPVPGSQLSIWPPTTITWSGCVLPVTSPEIGPGGGVHHMRLQQQMQAHRSARRHMLDQIGIGHAQGASRNPGASAAYRVGAGMRGARRAGGDRAGKIGERAPARSFRWRVARRDRRAITAAILGAGHGLVDQHDLALEGISGRGLRTRPNS